MHEVIFIVPLPGMSKIATLGDIKFLFFGGLRARIKRGMPFGGGGGRFALLRVRACEKLVAAIINFHARALMGKDGRAKLKVLAPIFLPEKFSSSSAFAAFCFSQQLTI